MTNKIFIITGETATGKTKYAVELARQNNGELINVDSRQIYKHLDIITGKDLTDKNFHLDSHVGNFGIGYYNIAENFPIWLYDITTPDNYFSAYDFQQCVVPVIKDIFNRGKTPILVGGSYFYIQYLLYNSSTKKIEPDWELRNNLEKKSIEELQHILQELNEEKFRSLNQSDVNNPRRLMRYIEITTSQEELEPLDTSHILLSKKIGHDLDIKYIGLHYATKIPLEQAIEKRVDQRIHNGAIKEVENILKLGFKKNDPGLQTIGYKQIISYLEGEITKDEAVRQWILREKQYAKRQYTFMKKDKNIIWQISC